MTSSAEHEIPQGHVPSCGAISSLRAGQWFQLGRLFFQNGYRSIGVDTI